MIRCHAQRATTGYVQQTSEKATSRGTVAMLAEHRVEQWTIPIDRAVEVAPAPRDLHIRLVQIPGPAATTVTARPKVGADERGEAELPDAAPS